MKIHQTLRLLGLSFSLALLFLGRSAFFLAHEAQAADPPDEPRATTPQLLTDFGQMPLYFIENQGQLDEQVAYYLQGSDKTLYFTAQGVTFALTETEPEAETQGGRELEEKFSPSPLEGEGRGGGRYILKLDFIEANPAVHPIGRAPHEAVVSYFKGSPEEWQTGLPTYAQLVYPDLWPGIDLVYYGTANQLKYEFIVQPGADPAQIRLAYRGATEVLVNPAGQLEVQTPAGAFHDDSPYAYQEMDGRRVAVPVAYALDPHQGQGDPSTAAYGFDLAAYDPTRPLVLDPAVLIYAGFIGGSALEYGSGIAVDSAGNAYITGDTVSSEATFPDTIGPDSTFNGGSSDAFVVKVRADGAGLVYAGYIGGSSSDSGNGIAVDSAGNAYITGDTNSSEATFPDTIGPDLTSNGVRDAFVAKVRADGAGLVYAGYIGGSSSDSGNGIAVDSAGNAYITGNTNSSEATFPDTIGPDLTFNGVSSSDAFVAKVRADGAGLVYAGYIGGSDIEFGNRIAVDSAGNAYISGETASSEATFPDTIGPDLTFNGLRDAFVAKVSADGAGLVYAGYIGGSDREEGVDIAVDSAGNAYISGETASSEATFPDTIGPDSTFNGVSDAFVAKVSADGAGLVYAGYIGGSDFETGNGIAVDSAGNAYITGNTSSSEATFPDTIGPDLTSNGGTDTFVAKVRADGAGLVYAGYIGGSGSDSGSGIAVDSAGNAYISGNTASSEATFPDTIGPDSTFNGGSSDAFVAKVRYTPILQVSVPSLNFSAVSGGSNPPAQTFTISDIGGGLLNWTASDNMPWLTLNPISGVAPATVTAAVNTSGLSANTYTGQITISSSNAQGSPKTINVTLTVQPPVLQVSVSSLNFSAVAGGGNPSAQAFTISSSGGSFNWTASDNMPWLTLNPTSGTAPPNATVTAAVNTSGLSANTYTGQMTISSPNAQGSPKTINVTLTIQPANVPVDLAFRRRAQEFLEEIRLDGDSPEWDAAVLGSTVRPLYRLNVAGVAYYEFPVITPPAGPAGFIIVSTGEHDWPVPNWNSTGLPPSQQLDALCQCQGQIAKYYKVNTLTYVGEDAAGNLVANMGQLPSKVVGVTPEMLNQPPELKEVVWTPSGVGEDDETPLTWTVAMTGPQTSSVDYVAAWNSWSDIKQEYASAYALLDQAHHNLVAPEWEYQNAIRDNGIDIHEGETYVLPLLSTQTSILTFSGEGAQPQYIQTSLESRSGLPSQLNLTALDAVPDRGLPLTVTINYGAGVVETQQFYIVEAKYFIYLPLVIKGLSGIGEQSNEIAATAKITKVWAGGTTFSQADALQPKYDQYLGAPMTSVITCYSGCVPTAWGILIGWADAQAEVTGSRWYGRWNLYRFNGGLTGASHSVAPRVMTTTTGVVDGPKNMIWQLRRRLGTFCSGIGGATSPANFINTQQYLTAVNTGVQVSVVNEWNGIHTHPQVIVAGKAAINQGTPFVAAFTLPRGGHAVVAYGYRAEITPQNRTYCAERNIFGICVRTITDQRSIVNVTHFYLNYGWGGSNNSWIKAAEIQLAGVINPR